MIDSGSKTPNSLIYKAKHPELKNYFEKMENLRQNSLADKPFFQFFINLLQKNIYKNNHNKAKEEAAAIIAFCNQIKKIVGHFQLSQEPEEESVERNEITEFLSNFNKAEQDSIFDFFHRSEYLTASQLNRRADEKVYDEIFFGGFLDEIFIAAINGKVKNIVEAVSDGNFELHNPFESDNVANSMNHVLATATAGAIGNKNSEEILVN